MSLEHVLRARCESFLTDKDRISGFMRSFFLLLLFYLFLLSGGGMLMGY